MRCGLCGFPIIKSQTALYSAMHCTVSCSGSAVMSFCELF